MKTSLGANLLKPGEPVLIAVLDGDIQLQMGLQRTAAELGHANWRVKDYSGANGFIEKIAAGADAILIREPKPNSASLEKVRSLKSFSPNLPVVLLAGQTSQETVFRHILGGANGWLVEPVSFPEVATALNEVMHGSPALCAQAQAAMIEIMGGGLREFKSKIALTLRQRDILSFFMRRLRDKEIAEALGIEEGTVRVHVANLFKKLQVHNRAQALKKWLECA